MANISVAVTSYPGTIDTRTTLVDGTGNDTIQAIHHNGVASAVISIETELGTDPAGSLTDVATRLNVALNADGTVRSTVVAAGAGASVAYSAGVFTLGWRPDGPGYVSNLGIEVVANSPVANALRIRLTQRSGATPTSAAPIRLSFPVATASSSPSNGTYVERQITGETNIGFSSGSSLGTIIGETARIYVGALDTDGVVETVAWNPKIAQVASNTAVRLASLWKPSEVATYTTVAEGGAGAADSEATLYSTTARTGVFIRQLGYIDVTVGSGLGNWSNNPTLVRLIGPGVPTTGDVLHTIGTLSSTAQTGTTQAVADGTIPQIGEGNLYLWATLTSSNTTNPVLIESIGQFADTQAGGMRFVGHVHRNSEANALVTAAAITVDSSMLSPLPLSGMISTTTAGATGYYLIVGQTVAATLGFNAEGGAQRYGSSIQSFFRVSEICA